MIHRKRRSKVALFSKKVSSDPVAALRAELSAARAKRDARGKRVAAAEQLANAKRHEAEVAAADNVDDGVLDAIEQASRAAEDRQRTLAAGFMAIEAGAAEIEARLAAAVKQRDANICAIALEEMAAKIEKAFPKHVAATTELVNAIKSSIVSIPETKQLADHLIITENQIDEAVALVISELKTGAAAVRDGTRRFRTEAPVSPVEVPPAVPLTRVYVLGRAIKWLENGEVRTASAFSNADVSCALVPAAIHRDLVDLPGSARAISYKASRGQSWDAPLADTAGLIDLDAVAAEVAAEHDAAAITDEAAE
jgi:hypothetical protein